MRYMMIMQAPESMAVGAITDRAHHRHNLFNRRWIGWVLLALVSFCVTYALLVVGGH